MAESLKNKDRIPGARIATVANGVSLDRMQSVEPINLHNEFNIEPGVTTLIIVGRLHEAKGHMDLLPVFASLIHKRYKLHLLVVGEGELEKLISDQIS